MFELTIQGGELFNPGTNQFIYLKPQTIKLEHSLVSISKWEAKWQKPFLTKETKSVEESKDYVRCMTITQNVDNNIYERLTTADLKLVSSYIDNPMTATSLKNPKGKKNREVFTSEFLYYLIFANGIDISCQKWHLNRLLTLLNIFSLKNNPKNKRSKREIMESNRAENQRRRAALNSKG